MERWERWVSLGSFFIVVISGAFWFGRWEAQESKALERIDKAKDEAIGEFQETLKKTFSYPDTTTYEWNQGDEEVKMIRVREGLCYLVYVRGLFEGQGEYVSIYERGDFWFLGGASQKVAVRARARCWKFPIDKQGEEK